MTTRKKRGRSRQQGSSLTQILIVVGTAVVAVALLAALNSGRLLPAKVGKLAYETGVTPDGQPYKGSPDAPLKLIEYSDFSCIHCVEFAAALNALGPDYIRTGKVQVIYRNFPSVTPEPYPSAQAAECALDQGADKFWQYHDLLFANPRDYSNTRLKMYAQEIGLDMTAFNRCLDSGVKYKEVQADHDAGASQGVEGTPTWFLNGQKMPGALPEDQLRQLFDEMLSKGSVK